MSSETDAQKYLTSDLKWEPLAVSRVSGPLAEVIQVSSTSGLEGVSFPVFAFPKVPEVLWSQAIAPDDHRWAQFMGDLGARHENATAAMLRWLAEHGIPVSHKTTLLGGVSFSIAEERLHELLNNDKFSIQLAELDAPGQLELNVSRVTVHANSQAALDLGLDGKDQRIAVLDGEINAAHPGLVGRVFKKQNFSSSDWNASTDNAGEEFCQRHSTEVAGIIAGNGGSSTGATDYKGIAPKAEIWNYKIAPSDARGSKVIQAMEAAHFDGCRIINLSWGATKVSPDGRSAWTQTAEALFAQGTLVVKSAGNTGPNAGTISVPADGEHVVAVGATARDGSSVHDGSSRGPTADGRVKPDVVAPGGGTIAPSSDNYEATLPPGTSFAAPFVAGAMVLLRQARPDATASMIREAILSSCSVMPQVASTTCGNGLLDIETALRKLKAL